MSAIAVFLRFVSCDADGNIDASRIVSRECYEKWLKSKEDKPPRDPEEAFRKAVTGHCSYLNKEYFHIPTV